MKHIFLNLKRFDVPVELGGVNRLAPVAEWGRAIVAGTQQGLTGYDPAEAEFVDFFPEAHLIPAAAAPHPPTAGWSWAARGSSGPTPQWAATSAPSPPTGPPTPPPPWAALDADRPL